MALSSNCCTVMVRSTAPMVHEVDLLILGGGCAGLSLAQKLSALGNACPTVLVVEQRAVYCNDRTWCFWDNHDQGVTELVTHHWRWLKLGSQARTVLFDCGPSHYQMLAASSFYERAQQAIAGCSKVTLALGEAVTAEPTQISGGWRVVTSQRQITARWVVDTRPWALPAAGGAMLWQSFYGQEICCEQEVFNSEAAELMDFTAGANGQIPFTYVLPVSRHRALVEATVFGPAPLARAALSAQLDSAVQQYTSGSPFSIARSESGILPMGLALTPPSLGLGHVAVGVMAGGARASSGFAFQRIQQWAEQCCAALATGSLPTTHRADPLLVRMMDRLFLKVLRASPQAAPDLFLSLFEHADSACVIRFLSGKSTVMDCLLVMKALPARPFVQQLFSRAPALLSNRAG